jgi:hypothetical protein
MRRADAYETRAAHWSGTLALWQLGCHVPKQTHLSVLSASCPDAA